MECRIRGERVQTGVTEGYGWRDPRDRGVNVARSREYSLTGTGTVWGLGRDLGCGFGIDG